MKNSDIVDELESKLLSKAPGGHRRQRQKERNGSEMSMMWVKTPETRALSKSYYPQLKQWGKAKTFKICEVLLKRNVLELKIIAFDWSFRFKKEFEPEDFKYFSRWAQKYIDDWIDCDDFCTHSLGEFLYQYPQYLNDVYDWGLSKKWQVRRVAAVALIYSVRKQKYIREVFKTANRLVQDDHDLVRKGYGWMLKEASKNYQRSVFKYVMVHKRDMPRVSLRYAVEKLPPSLRREAMKIE